MNRKRLVLLCVAFGTFLLLPGCVEEAPPPAPPAPKKVAAPAPAPAPAQTAAAVVEPLPPKYVYDQSGRRDPFVPLTMVKKPLSPQQAPLTPLQTYDLGQLRLIGVIVGKGASTAMVTAPDGKSYILKKGTRVGKNEGIVVGIKPDTVLVEERYYDFSGVIRKNVESIQLPKREGVE